MALTAHRPPHHALDVDAGVIEEARRRQRRTRSFVGAGTTAAIVAIVLAVAWGGGNGAGSRQAPGRPSSGARGLAGRNGASGSTQLISVVGVSLLVPREWVGRTMVLWVGAGNSAWLQATNFPPQELVRGEARIKAMRPGDIAVTICECNESIEESTQRNRVRPLTLAGDVVPSARMPRGHLVLESSVLINGRLLTIDADFGSRSDRLLPVVNSVLRTLRVRQAGNGQSAWRPQRFHLSAIGPMLTRA